MATPQHTRRSDVDAENLGGSLDDGILTIRIPKTGQARPRRIEIGSSRSSNGGSAATDGS